MTAAAASSQGSAPRYAPEDPTLPKPWKGLVAGSTGYLYYWNPVTNVTQYERPVAEVQLPAPPPIQKLAPLSSVQVHQHNHDEGGKSRSYQHQNVRVSGARSEHGLADSVHGSGIQNHMQGSVHSRTYIRNHESFDAGVCLSAEAYRRQHEITVTGDDIPAPYMTFESTGFPPDILKEVHRAGFSTPTPIQAQSWPVALQSRDVVAIAKTGSGKTIGYLFPGFLHLKRLHNNPKVGPTVLVLSPTRELATQIQVEAEKFGRSSRISCTCLYGGAPKSSQLRDLERGVDIVVATPGRLNDILEMRRISLRQVSYLVLDEADRMLDMGFEPQIRKIVKEVPHRRQTLMFTATWPKEVRNIAADLLVNPIQISIGNIDELVANKAITQYVELIKPVEKQRRLEQILRSQEAGSKVIIFCTTKRMCDQLARSLVRHFGAAAIHGDKSQMERDRVLGQFKTGRSPILVATDVAARGLDIKDIRVVINYDFPTGVEDYVHRIGRTGRAGATGISYTFFSDHDSKYALELVKVLEGANQRVPPELRDLATRCGYGGKSRRWGSGSSARDRGRFGAGRNDSSNTGKSGHGLSSSRIDANHEYSNYGRDRDDRDSRFRRLDGHAVETHVNNNAKVVLRGRSRSPSFSPSPRRGRTVLGNGRSRSHSRSWEKTRGHSSCSRSRSRSRSIGRGRFDTTVSFGRTSPPSKRKERSADHHRGEQSPSRRKRIETLNDRHRGSPSYPKRDASIDRHYEPSPQKKEIPAYNHRRLSSPKMDISIDCQSRQSPPKREKLIDRYHRSSPARSERENMIDHYFGQSPSANRLNSAVDQSRTSDLKSESSLIEPGHDSDVWRPDSRDCTPSLRRQRSQSPYRQMENGVKRVSSSLEQLRRSSSPHHLGETVSDRPMTPKCHDGVESGKLYDETIHLASPRGNQEDVEEGLIPPYEEEG